jgi:hypothetical protein
MLMTSCGGRNRINDAPTPGWSAIRKLSAGVAGEGWERVDAVNVVDDVDEKDKRKQTISNSASRALADGA